MKTPVVYKRDKGTFYSLGTQSTQKQYFTLNSLVSPETINKYIFTFCLQITTLKLS